MTQAPVPQGPAASGRVPPAGAAPARGGGSGFGFPPSFLGDSNLEYIELKDFTPGIFAGRSVPVQQAIDGAAQINGTFDCVASLTGELTPGPRRTYRYSDTVNTDINLASGTQAPEGFESIRIQEFRVFSPVYGLNLTDASSIITPNDETLPDQVFVGFDWFNLNTGTYRQRHRVITYKFQQVRVDPFRIAEQFKLAPPTFTLKTNSYGAGPGSGVWNGIISMDFSRTDVAAPTTSGSPVAAFVMWPVAVSGSGATSSYYPDNTAPGTDAIAPMASATPYFIVAHQDRIVGIGVIGGGEDAFGTNSSVRGEQFSATAVNNLSSASTIGIYVAENPYGVGTWNSSNASELLIIKQRGGGFLLRGDVAGTPIVVRLPGIASAYPPHRGVMTHLGFVYGNKQGVWLWPGGGDSSICLSDQIDGFFWNPFATLPPVTTQDDNYNHYTETRPFNGSFGYTYPYVFAPNNFLYDMRTAGWWKISQPGKYPLMWFEASANGNMVAGPTHIDDGDRLLINWYNPNEGSNSYQWTSQPLTRSRNRYLNFREVVLFAIGEAAHVEITVTGIDGESSTATFDFDSPTQRIALRQELSVQGSDVVVTINAQSKDLTKAAPALTLALGFSSTSHVA